MSLYAGCATQDDRVARTGGGREGYPRGWEEWVYMSGRERHASRDMPGWPLETLIEGIRSILGPVPAGGQDPPPCVNIPK